MEPGVIHLLEASVKLECSLEVTARGLLLYHHFMRCAAEIRYDEDMVAAGALSLSGRLYEQPLDIDAIICVFYSIVNQTCDVMSSDDVAYLVIKQTLIHFDFMMIRLLEFDLTHRLAHQYLVPFLLMIFERSKNISEFRAELGKTCLRFMSDFYTQQICLEYSPELIAVACIDLSLHLHGLINELAMVPPWYMGFVCDVTPDKVKVIKKLIMNLYDKPLIQAPETPVSSDELRILSTHAKKAFSNMRPRLPSTDEQDFDPSPVSSQRRVLPSIQRFLPNRGQQRVPAQVESMDICAPIMQKN